MKMKIYRLYCLNSEDRNTFCNRLNQKQKNKHGSIQLIIYKIVYMYINLMH